MPGHYNMPVIPNRYPLDKNDKLGLAIGALLSGGLAAANSNRNMGENPLLRGFAGGVTGFGAGANQIQDSYSKMLDDYLKGEGMDFRNRQMTQEQQQFRDTLGLNREKFAEEKRQYEEAEKLEKQAKTRWYDEREAKTPKLPTSVAEWEYGQNIKNPRQRSEFFNRYSPLKTKKEGGDKTTQQLLEEAINEGNVGGATKQPPQITIDQFLNEARKVNPGVSDDELTRYYNKKYRQ